MSYQKFTIKLTIIDGYSIITKQLSHIKSVFPFSIVNQWYLIPFHSKFMFVMKELGFTLQTHCLEENNEVWSVKTTKCTYRTTSIYGKTFSCQTQFSLSVLLRKNIYLLATCSHNIMLLIWLGWLSLLSAKCTNSYNKQWYHEKNVNYIIKPKTYNYHIIYFNGIKIWANPSILSFIWCHTPNQENFTPQSKQFIEKRNSKKKNEKRNPQSKQDFELQVIQMMTSQCLLSMIDRKSIVTTQYRTLVFWKSFI